MDRVPAPRTSTTRTRRRGWTPRRQSRYEALLSAHGVSVDDIVAGRLGTDLVVEFGVGQGETALASALDRPGSMHLAVEVHAPALSVLLAEIARQGVRNLRVVDADARDVARGLAAASASEVRVLFPDPWPKVRHHRRRLIDAEFLDATARLLTPGGRLHVATDVESYADSVRGLLENHEAFAEISGERPSWRVETRYEQRGRLAGRQAVDIGARRVAPFDQQGRATSSSR